MRSNGRVEWTRCFCGAQQAQHILGNFYILLAVGCCQLILVGNASATPCSTPGELACPGRNGKECVHADFVCANGDVHKCKECEAYGDCKINSDQMPDRCQGLEWEVLDNVALTEQDVYETDLNEVGEMYCRSKCLLDVVRIGGSFARDSSCRHFTLRLPLSLSGRQYECKYSWKEEATVRKLKGYTTYSLKDRDECVKGGEGDKTCHSQNLSCYNTFGSFYCACSNGTRENREGECVDVNECLDGTATCNTTSRCKNLFGGYFCVGACKTGFIQDLVSNSCVDEDECGTGKHSCTHSKLCINIQGSFVCHCPVGHGFVRNEHNGECSDVDECKDAEDNFNITRCPTSSLQSCYNTVGSFICKCVAGYKYELSSSGLVCLDTNECNDAALNDCYDTLSGVCINTNGSFLCRCPTNMDGNGVTCTTRMSGEQKLDQINSVTPRITPMLIILLIVFAVCALILILVAIVFTQRRREQELKKEIDKISNSGKRVVWDVATEKRSLEAQAENAAEFERLQRLLETKRLEQEQERRISLEIKSGLLEAISCHSDQENVVSSVTEQTKVEESAYQPLEITVSGKDRSLSNTEKNMQPLEKTRDTLYQPPQRPFQRPHAKSSPAALQGITLPHFLHTIDREFVEPCLAEGSSYKTVSEEKLMDKLRTISVTPGPSLDTTDMKLEPPENFSKERSVSPVINQRILRSTATLEAKNRDEGEFHDAAKLQQLPIEESITPSRSQAILSAVFPSEIDKISGGHTKPFSDSMELIEMVPSGSLVHLKQELTGESQSSSVEISSLTSNLTHSTSKTTSVRHSHLVKVYPSSAEQKFNRSRPTQQKKNVRFESANQQESRDKH